MVALLFDDGLVPAALELEMVWNDLLARHPFSLLCAYPRKSFESGEGRGVAYTEVCCLHSDVMVDMPQLVDAERSCAFARGPRAPGEARRFVTEVLHQWGLAELVDKASLVVTELATNAVVHARSGFSVSLARSGTVVRIAIGDTDAGAPRSGPDDITSEQGRGLPLIDAMTSDWGHTAVPDGKLVWAELDPGRLEPELSK
jgi:anti-sigma regulatory factor (Ser/Thr protein kinase)